MDDIRLDELIAFLREHHAGGFVNNAVRRRELLDALEELKQARERGHCPGCHGDHP